ncbi:g2449 [Coccomyxa viridis]|uniref:G2449 protein n=1 Tax=Coccomyxa viridis TaxID=1274662 RepID=A0ABP1FKE6_9CHLO
MKSARRTRYRASRPNGTGQCTRVLDLTEGRIRVLTPEASRGLLKRRYKEIICDFSDVSMRERRVGMSEETAGDVVQALLPSLLAACSPETELTLKVLPTQGEEFLTLPHGTGAYVAHPQLSTFLAGLKQHLTDLHLNTYGNQGRVQHLEVLNELTALQKLRMCLKAADMADKYGRVPNCTLSGKRFAWKLPKLDHLALCCLEAGTIVLSCPKLAEISLARTESLRVEIKDAALESLGHALIVAAGKRRTVKQQR